MCHAVPSRDRSGQAMKSTLNQIPGLRVTQWSKSGIQSSSTDKLCLKLCGNRGKLALLVRENFTFIAFIWMRRNFVTLYRI